MIDEDKLLALAERTFNTEVDEVLARDIIRLMQKIMEPNELWVLHNEEGVIQEYIHSDSSLAVFENEDKAKKASELHQMPYSKWNLVKVKL